MELLAPAGNLEAAVAAFQYGADAIYLGLRDFSARADADNFTLDDLNTILGIAHHNPDWPRKVYVAVNTLLRQQELPRLIQLLSQLRDMEVDALIIQDWAVYQLVQDYFPDFEIHASTQMAIHNPEGAQHASELGFSRVVLARELSVPEIERIAAIPNLETEVFIHGALCYAYSGLCMLSAALRGTSGNRGSCEYICRACYQAKYGDFKPVPANVMSMKDLATPDCLTALKKAKVTSLKIEGRKKTPLYVAAVTNYYRNLLDGTFEPGEQQRAEADIKTIFSRPWTPFHLKNRRQIGITDIHTVGHRGTDVGIVSAIVEGTPDRLRFNVKNQPLEKHDGLQVELPTRDKPFGFPVDDIRLFPQRNNDTWKNAFEAPIDATVEVALPEEHPEIPVGSRIFCSSSQAVKRSYDWETPRPALCKARIPVYFKLIIHDRELTVIAQPTAGKHELDDVRTVLPLDESLSAAKQPEKVEAAVKQAFAKLGDTNFTLADIQIDNPDGLYVPASFLNEARRRSAEDIADAMDQNARETADDVLEKVSAWKPPLPKPPAKLPRWTLKIDRPYFLNVFQQQDLDNVDEVIFSIARTPEHELGDALAELESLLGTRNKIRIALPSIFRPDTGYASHAAIEMLLQAGYLRWEAANIASLKLLENAGANLRNLSLTADWPLFVTNTYAAKALREQGFQRIVLSPDDTWQNWLQLVQTLGHFAEVPVFQNTPLAFSDVCAMSSFKEFCPGKNACTFTTLKLDNPRKDEHLLAVNNNCQTVILNERPLNLAGHVNELFNAGVTRFRADFCWFNYAPTTVKRFWDMLQNDSPSADTWTANLFR